jgi:hypothetical protein
MVVLVVGSLTSVPEAVGEAVVVLVVMACSASARWSRGVCVGGGEGEGGEVEEEDRSAVMVNRGASRQQTMHS